MTLKKFWQFFEADDGRMSMTRLLCFLAFWPSSYKLILIDSKDVADAFMWYLGAFVLGYVGGKFADAKAAAGAPTNINVENVEEVKTAGGDRNVPAD